ncbi:UNVERIFIED_CONTAM: hypothetical protein FKN15_074660 [Acipenser sinensis]
MKTRTCILRNECSQPSVFFHSASLPFNHLRTYSVGERHYSELDTGGLQAPSQPQGSLHGSCQHRCHCRSALHHYQCGHGWSALYRCQYSIAMASCTSGGSSIATARVAGAFPQPEPKSEPELPEPEKRAASYSLVEE